MSVLKTPISGGRRREMWASPHEKQKRRKKEQQTVMCVCMFVHDCGAGVRGLRTVRECSTVSGDS